LGAFLKYLHEASVLSGLPVHEVYKYFLAKRGEGGARPPDHISINTSPTRSSYQSQIIGMEYLVDHINAILTETASTLRAKLGQSDADVKQALRLISRHAEVVRPTLHLEVLDDPDNRILECGVAAGADLIVTGDRHLLRLGSFRGISIVRLVDLLRSFPGDAV
jgi:hypothetical protein